MATTSLTPEALVGVMLAACEARFLSVQPWPLEAAFEGLELEAESGGSVRRTLGRMPRTTGVPGPRFLASRKIIDSLVRRELLTPTGSGWKAGYEVSPAWIAESDQLLGELSDSDAAAVRSVAQGLVAMTTMASKKPVTSLTERSATI